MKPPVLLCMLSLVLLSGCNSIASNMVEISNNASFHLEAVEVDIGGRTIHVGRIGPNERRTVGFEPVSDSSLSIRYLISGRSAAARCDGDVYVTNGAPNRFRVTFDPNGACTVEMVD